MIWLLFALAFWAGAWGMNIWLAKRKAPWVRIAVPVVFGVTILVLWEGVVRGLSIDSAILPAPSVIWAKIVEVPDMLWTDFVQTVLKGGLSGYVLGSAAGIGAAILVDRFGFLQRGLLPIGNFVAALPVVGVAPIMVMWFGFGWESKAAVVIAMVFFPMLINTVAGLQATDGMQRDLMKTYAASYAQTLFALRLPAAMPFIFNGLKICSTLALIGAIVAEYFGSPTRGMGFRIQTGMGRLALDLVWAEIALAAVAGAGFYGLVTAFEKRMTFWHPSQRGNDRS